MSNGYVQCSLACDDGLQEVAWIPGEFARRGRRIRVDGDPVEKTVTETFGRVADAAKLERYCRTHRKGTDI